MRKIMIELTFLGELFLEGQIPCSMAQVIFLTEPYHIRCLIFTRPPVQEKNSADGLPKVEKVTPIIHCCSASVILKE